MTPVTAVLKLYLHKLIIRDDVIGDSPRPIWEFHFQKIRGISNTKYQLAFVPENVVSLDIDVFGDASKLIICVVIYKWFKRKNENYYS